MPKDLPTEGCQALTNAERQARYRARKAEQARTIIRYRRPADRCTRPQRWHAAVAELLALQAEYTAWANALADALPDTTTAEALQAIVDLDPSDLADIEPPRGYGKIRPKQQRSGENSFATSGENSSAVDSRPLWQHGQAVVAGSMTTSSRGRCFGKPPILRALTRLLHLAMRVSGRLAQVLLVS
jgi:hypothetical protein